MSCDQPDDCSELSERLAGYYEGRKPTDGQEHENETEEDATPKIALSHKRRL